MTPPLPDQVDFAAKAAAGVIRAEESVSVNDIDFEFRRAQVYANLAIAQAVAEVARKLRAGLTVWKGEDDFS